jgi:hypothetical protein
LFLVSGHNTVDCLRLWESLDQKLTKSRDLWHVTSINNWTNIINHTHLQASLFTPNREHELIFSVRFSGKRLINTGKNSHVTKCHITIFLYIYSLWYGFNYNVTFCLFCIENRIISIPWFLCLVHVHSPYYMYTLLSPDLTKWNFYEGKSPVTIMLEKKRFYKHFCWRFCSEHEFILVYFDFVNAQSEIQHTYSNCANVFYEFFFSS